MANLESEDNANENLLQRQQNRTSDQTDQLDEDDNCTMRTQSLASNAQQQAEVQEQDADDGKNKCDWTHWWPRLVIIGILIVLIVLVIVFSSQISTAIQDFLTWVQDHPALGPLLLVLVYIVCTVCLIPGSILTIGAGWAFQQAYNSTGIAILVGSIAVFLGAWCGSVLAFFLGKYVFREKSESFAQKYKVTKALDKVIQHEGLKVVLLLRLCPLVPFTYFNYVMGITAVSFFDYAVGGLGMIPGTIVYVFVGTTIGSITDAATGNYDAGWAGLTLLIVGSVLACVAIIYVSIIVKRYLNKQMEEDNRAEQSAAYIEGTTEQEQECLIAVTGQTHVNGTEHGESAPQSPEGLRR